MVFLCNVSRLDSDVSGIQYAYPENFFSSNILKNNNFHKNAEKISFSEKKGLRVRAANRKYPFTGGAEAHNGAPDGPHGNETQNKHQRQTRRGAPESYGASHLVLSLRSLKKE